ncbi:hemopexin repeat-containing protein [Streptomyces sp. NPDC017248]|uniref:hemopexin repeat-containing protein n=1 Tax=unclassified Streptomyces TaxID=2593676 RepID=UPI0037B52FB5
MGTKVYFFKNGQYARYDRAVDATDDGYPLPVAGNWKKLAESGFDQPDAALNLEDGKLYFFKADRYIRYDITADQVDDGYPLSIADQWPGLGSLGPGIDAAVNWGNGKAYFFRGDSYVRYDITAGTADPDYPKRIADTWTGMAAAGFGTGLDAAVNWGNGKVFFFKDGNYVRYDIAGDRVDDGYPLPIAGQWPGLAEAGFGSGIRAGTDLFDGRQVWLPDAERLPAAKNGPRYLALPWRGVLHTTEGAGVDGALQEFRATNFWPTVTIEPNTLRVIQHLPLNTGARALSDSATAENAARCVQVEIVGFAAQTPTWAPEQLAFIRDVVQQIDTLVPIPRTSGRTFLDAGGVNATPGNRMSVDEWKRFSGWCGHQHVPGESHWDPGAIDISTILG